jgi:parallel beta-helix repeat protein
MFKETHNLTATLSLLVFILLNSAYITAHLSPGQALQKIAKHEQAYTFHSPIHINGNLDFLTQAGLEGWIGNGSIGNPIIISGYSFAAAEQMLRVENSNLHFEFSGNQLDGLSYIWCGIAVVDSANGVIKNNIIRRAAVAIHLTTDENMTIERNEAWDSELSGIVVEDGSTNVLVKDNIVFESGDYGILIGNPYGSATSHDIRIIGNTVYENSPGGIRALEADDCVVNQNTVYDNTLNGIIIESGSHYINDNNITNCNVGILINNGNCTMLRNDISSVEYGILIGTENNTISENYLTNNEKEGLRFFYSISAGEGGSHNIVTANVFANNSRYGLVFNEKTGGNQAKNNYFFMNGDKCQAFNDGSNNFIDSNYWDDWTTPDANNDSIVDNAYVIDGVTGNSDLHPMAIPDKEIPHWYIIDDTGGNETTTTESGIYIPNPDLVILSGISVIIVAIVVFVLKKRST